MVSILALSVTYGATSPKGRGLGKEMDLSLIHISEPTRPY